MPLSVVSKKSVTASVSLFPRMNCSNGESSPGIVISSMWTLRVNSMSVGLYWKSMRCWPRLHATSMCPLSGVGMLLLAFLRVAHACTDASLLLEILLARLQRLDDREHRASDRIRRGLRSIHHANCTGNLSDFNVHILLPMG